MVPPVWVLGSFTLNGGRAARHTAQLAADLAAAGSVPQLLSFHPGTYAADCIERFDMAPGARGVIYMRSAMRLPGGRSLRLWRARWRALRAAITASQRSFVIVSPLRPQPASLLEHLLAWALAHGARNRVRRLRLSVAPHRCVSRVLGTPTTAGGETDAEIWLLTHLSAVSRVSLRLTQAHLRHALAEAAPGIDGHTRQTLLSMTHKAQRIPAQAAAQALRRRGLEAGPHAPPAVRAALAPGLRSPDLPRIAEHLRLIGQPWRIWRRPAPGRGNRSLADRGLTPALLRHIAGDPAEGDAKILAPLRQPLGPGPMTQLDWLIAVALRLPVESIGTLKTPWRCPDLARAVREALPPPVAAATTPEDAALQLVGLSGTGTGLARNYWMSAQALSRAGIQPQLRPVDGRADMVSTLPPPRTRRQVTRPVTLLHLNADQIPQALLALEQGRSGFHIGFLLWELDRLPRAHRLALDMLDEIWVPSLFLLRLYRPAFRGRVILMRKGIALPVASAWPGPAPGVTRFLTCFDSGSSTVRKNPLAAVRAFQSAFPRADPSAELVVKTTPAPPGHWGDPEGQIAAIRALAARDPRITVIERRLPQADLLGLIGSADALISPHRAEGFGYFPAYALVLGVPVIATDYSGTQDFCTPLTALPVPARLRPVPAGHSIFKTPGARWADIDHDALVAALRKVVRDPAAARARAERGRMLMESDYSMAAHARRYAVRLEALGLLAPTEQDARSVGA